MNPFKEIPLFAMEDRRPTPGPWMSRASLAFGRAFKYLSRPMSVKERDREHQAIVRCKELSAKFQKLDTRQQRRCRAFAEAFSRTRKEIGGEPRRARRKVARVWAKQAMRSTKV